MCWTPGPALCLQVRKQLCWLEPEQQVLICCVLSWYGWQRRHVLTTESVHTQRVPIECFLTMLQPPTEHCWAATGSLLTGGCCPAAPRCMAAMQLQHSELSSMWMALATLLMQQTQNWQAAAAEGLLQLCSHSIELQQWGRAALKAKLSEQLGTNWRGLLLEGFHLSSLSSI